MTTTRALGLTSPSSSVLEPLSIERRALRSDDVRIRVEYCGICHSDIHAIDGATDDVLPMVPGHEFVGTVAEVGPAVTKFAPGDSVAVSNIVDSCGQCEPCLAGEESYCREWPTTTYNGADRIDGTRTLGAYANEYVAREAFVYHRPASIPAAAVAPLMCAGITTWAPLSRYVTAPGMRVGVVGLGGLGHMAVKFAVALGADVTVFTTSSAKRESALRLGARQVVDTTDPAAFQNDPYLDFVLDTVPTQHELGPYLDCLNLGGTMCIVGIPEEYRVPPLSLIMSRHQFTGSGSGGTRDVEAMLSFCDKHSIGADIELVKPAEINRALERLRHNDVRYRFVLDLT